MKRTLAILLSVMTLLAALCLTCAAEGDLRYVFDESSHLSAYQATELNRKLSDARELLGGADIVVIVTDDFDSDVKTQLARHGYASSDKDVIGLTVFCSGTTYEFDIGTWGSMSDTLSVKRLNQIMDVIEADVKAGRLFEGACKFVDATAEQYAKAIKKQNRNPFLVALPVALVIGVVAGGVAVLCVVFSYRKKNRTPSYPLDRFARLYLSVERDVFLGSSVVKTKIVQSSSSGGSRGGGGGGFHSAGRR